MKKQQMENTHVGIWIDQNEAMVVTLIDGRPVVELVRSNAEKIRPDHFHEDFYGEVIKAVGDTGHLYIFGPGNSKSELAAEVEKVRRHHYHIDAVETAGMLAENQVVAKVKSYFTPALAS